MTTQNSATGIEVDGDDSQETTSSENGLTVTVQGLHQRLTQVTLLDHTDRNNQLVSTREWLIHPLEAEKIRLRGNLFIVECPSTGDGKIFVKCAPLPNARQMEEEQVDLEVRAQRDKRDGEFDYALDHFEYTLHQTGPEDLETWKVLDYTGGKAGCTRVLQRWQRTQRPNSERHTIPRFMSNTWGDRNRDACINHDFIVKEIDRGAELGVDVIQIDDGWQKGRSANSAEATEKGGVWTGFWDANPDFWTPCPDRFPEGLEPLIDYAESKGVEIGLWYAPDSENEFTNWQKDVDQILKIHRSYGARHIKLDAIKTESIAARRNLRLMVNGIVRGSEGKIVCDLDVTAGVRPGYFGEMPLGVIFVENRYSDWHNYWPHFTLRNLWQLSQFIDPRRLRMEFLNNERNEQKYAGDPLAPALYPPSTLFAITLFANPLGWFENSGLSEAFIADVAPLVDVWKAHREQIFSGDILPIGDAPDGFSWTGFFSGTETGDTAYALLFNEASPDCNSSFELPENFDSVTVLSGSGDITVNASTLTADIPQSFGYILAQLHKTN